MTIDQNTAMKADMPSVIRMTMANSFSMHTHEVDIQAAFWCMMLAAAIAAALVMLRALNFRLPIRALAEPRPEDTRFLAALEAGGKGVLGETWGCNGDRFAHEPEAAGVGGCG
jgi:hypothetical protein